MGQTDSTKYLNDPVWNPEAFLNLFSKELRGRPVHRQTATQKPERKSCSCLCLCIFSVVLLASTATCDPALHLKNFALRTFVSQAAAQETAGVCVTAWMNFHHSSHLASRKQKPAPSRRPGDFLCCDSGAMSLEHFLCDKRVRLAELTRL